MNILEFVNLAKKHRLSVKNVDYPCDSETWKAIFIEALFRNNSVLLNELYLKCPAEYKEEISQHIDDIVFSRTMNTKNEYSQTILKWIFNNLDVNLNEVFHPVFLAENARGDIIEYLIQNNSENIYGHRLYEISKWLAKEEQFELFKKIASELNLNNLHDLHSEYRGIKSPESNPFIELFDNSREKEVLKYVLKNLPEDMDFFLSIIKRHAITSKHMGENIESSSMLDITLSFMKEHRPTLFSDLKNKIYHNESKVVFKCLSKLSIYNVKVLENYEMCTRYLLWRAIETAGNSENNNILAHSLEFLYENFSQEKIDESFSEKHKMELFSNLIIRGSIVEADFIFNKAPFNINDETKSYITSTLLQRGLGSGDSGLAWAKKHLTYDEIDKMSQKSFYNRNLEQLTLWKCENFLYSESKNIDNRVEKKKIKI